MLVLSSLNSIFPSIFCLGLINSSFPPPSPSPLPSSPSASPSPLKDDDIGFVARLIHRTSPQSPFYNPLANQEDLMAKDIHISQQRSVYFSQLTTITKGETNMMVRAPMMSKNFLMKFSIGTPPQQTFAVPDTGSSLIWMQCSPCDKCYNQNRIAPIYNREKSSTFRQQLCVNFYCGGLKYLTCLEKSICQYNLSYEDKSMSTGFIAEESFTFEANDFTERTTLENIDFGCGTRNIDGSGLGVPGIIGLGNDRVSLIRQLNYPYFSYCVTDERIDPRGWIHFGSAARLLGRSTPITTHTSFYYLSIEGITVRGEEDEEVNLPKEFFDYGFVIDSGSTYTVLYNGAFDALIEKVKSMYDDEAEKFGDYELCYEEISDVPEIVFKFKDLDFRLNDQNTWLRAPNGFICLAMFRANETSIFGMYQQRRVNVGFNLRREKFTLKNVNSCPDEEEEEED
ncbi:hypothetical protein ACSBR2_001547 [Camellia fascicularis]